MKEGQTKSHDPKPKKKKKIKTYLTYEGCDFSLFLQTL